VLTLNTSASPDATATDSTHLVLTAHSGDATALQLSASDFPATSCAISPSLPTGMTFNTTTCAIGGNSTTQTASTGSSAYTITPTGAGGVGTAIELKLKIYRKWCDGHSDTGVASNGKKYGTGLTSGSAYILCGKDGLNFLKNTVDGSLAGSQAYYKLQSDIDLATDYLPIGTVKAFNGNFDGGGHIISNQFIEDTGSPSSYGLFAYAKTSTISNLVINNSHVLTTGGGGSLLGNVKSSSTVTISNVLIKNSEVLCDDSSYTNSGLLVGYVASSSTLVISNILEYSSLNTASSTSVRAIVGVSIGSTRNYSGVIFDSAMTTSLNYILDDSPSSGAITSSSLSNIKNQSSLYSSFSSSFWDTTLVGSATPSAPSLKVRDERVYSDYLTGGIDKP
jgi:hypothetical protein